MRAEDARAVSADALTDSPTMRYVRRCISWMAERRFFLVDVPLSVIPGSDALRQITAQLKLEGYDILDDIPGYLSISWEKRNEKKGGRPFRKR